MIDSTKSPVPLWKRYGIVILLSLLILVAGYEIWSKEIHHTNTGSATGSTPAAAQTAPATSSPSHASAPATTIPGGVPISSRNPFGS